MHTLPDHIINTSYVTGNHLITSWTKFGLIDTELLQPWNEFLTKTLITYQTPA